MMLVALPATLVFRPDDDDPLRKHTEVAGKWSLIALTPTKVLTKGA
jgi:hypothetical protein